MSDAGLAILKVVIAAAGCGVYVWQRRCRRSRSANAAAWVLALLAMGAYFHFFQFPFHGYYHRWEMFHYYLGSKYSSELGYLRLYRCVAVADAETGLPSSVMQRAARDLETDRLLAARTFLDDPELCTRHFSEVRWRDFRRDVVWFRQAAADRQWWEEMQQDHGYNATPVWTLLAHPLANQGPVSDARLKALAALDVVLMLGGIVVLAWAFGQTTATTALLFWGTQAPSDFFWTGGAFLRQDWLFWLLVSAALLRKRWMFGAGAALMAAGLLRVFPLLLWLGPLLFVLHSARRQHRLTHEHRRLLLGGACCAAILVGLSAAVGGWQAYRDFPARMRLRAESPISNHMSLRTLFSVDPAARLYDLRAESGVDAVSAWEAARRARLAETRPLYRLTAALLVGVWAWTVWRVRSAWLALCLSIALIPALTDPSCYYYSVFLLAAPLARVRRDLAVALAALAAAGQLLCLRFPWIDDRFVALAALYVVFTVALLLACTRLYDRRKLYRRPVRLTYDTSQDELARAGSDRDRVRLWTPSRL